ncbi:NUDIX domain-containing protein [Streptomyces sp. Ru72]|uniref:NUDIX domain-containing protein n=1 Tax=Streptomyces sp. Ru72 TaxID=2080747 RepID=UPI000CDDFEA3|nr:hypothetical protein C3488_33110 [Streptomyces sp. Ru72]
MTVIALLIRADGRYLLHLRDADKNICNAGQLCMPGGHPEPGESADEAIARELPEEAGTAHPQPGPARGHREHRRRRPAHQPDSGVRRNLGGRPHVVALPPRRSCCVDRSRADPVSDHGPQDHGRHPPPGRGGCPPPYRRAAARAPRPRHRHVPALAHAAVHLGDHGKWVRHPMAGRCALTTGWKSKRHHRSSRRPLLPACRRGDW